MYVLDTNTCIYIINHNPPNARARFEAVALSEIAISSITLFELDAGARKGAKAKANLVRLERFAAAINVLAFDASAARKAGELRQRLRELGTPIGDMDTLIAAHALAVGATVVTNNTQEFSRVPGLVLEDWLSE
jgi:tRNA(fMet)-specific endonuclease VapC